MAESSWPGPAPATVTEHMHELLWSAYHHSGLVGSPEDTDVVYADSTGMHVKVRPDRYGLVRGQVWTSGAIEFTKAIAPNASGQERKDRVVLRLDRSTWLVTTEVLQGTPGAGLPAVTRDPGPTGVWELLVADVTVANGAVTINAADVFLRHSFLMPQGIVADDGHGWGSDALHFLRYSPVDDEVWFQRPGPGSRVPLWTDSGWLNLGGAASGWSTTQSSWIRKIGKVVTCRLGNWRRTGSDLAAGADSRVLSARIPSSMRPNPPEDVDLLLWFDPPGSGNGSVARGSIYSTGHSSRYGQLWILNHNVLPNNTPLLGVSVTWMVD